MEKITEHVYWLPPGKPDRPSLCAVVGTERTLLLDTGASPAHLNLFLDALKSEKVAMPSLAVLTHWHWDHVFGAAELGVPLIAHRETRGRLRTLARYDWSNEALEHRVTTGEEIRGCAEDIKVELPVPRTVKIVLPTIVFRDAFELDLGDVTCHVQHVGGDHASDSCVIHVLPDKVLFLGDCLYPAIYAPVQHYTKEKLFPLLGTLLTFDAELFVEGHNDVVMTRAELISLAEKMRFAGELVEEIGANEEQVFATAREKLGQLDDDTDYALHKFIGKGNCTDCHSGTLFTNNDFQNTGVPAAKDLPEDLGRAKGVKQVLADEFNCLSPYSDATPEDCAELSFLKTDGQELERQFKVPTLRNISETALYMHAGQFATLQEVLEHYNQAPEAPAGHSELEPLNFSGEELEQLESLLKTLSDL